MQELFPTTPPFFNIFCYCSFGHPGGVFQPASRKVDILALHDEELVVEFLLPELEVVEEPPCPKFLSRTRPDDPEVLFDSDVIADAHDIEPSDPFLADELAIRHEAVDAVGPEKADEAFHQFLALLPIGIATFVRKSRTSFIYGFRGRNGDGCADV